MRWIFLIILLLSSISFAEVSGNLSPTCVGCLYGSTYSTTTTSTSTTTTTTIPPNQSTAQTTTTTIIPENETTNETSENMTTTTTIEEVETFSQTLNMSFSRKDLENVLKSKNLSDVINKIFGRVDAGKISKNTEDVIKDIHVEKNFYSSTNRTTISIIVKYTGRRVIHGFMLYETIPKDFAENISDMEIVTSLKYEVVRNDPEVLFYISELGNSPKTIAYKTSKKLDRSILNKTKTVIFVYSIEEKKSHGVGLIIVIVLLLVAGVVLFVFRKKIMDYLEVKAYVSKAYKKRTFIDDIIDWFKDKFSKKKKYEFKKGK